MIGNGFEFYFHWRKTFDVMKKCSKGHIFLRFHHIFGPTNFYSSKSLIFPWGTVALLTSYLILNT